MAGERRRRAEEQAQPGAGAGARQRVPGGRRRGGIERHVPSDVEPGLAGEVGRRLEGAEQGEGSATRTPAQGVQGEPTAESGAAAESAANRAKARASVLGRMTDWSLLCGKVGSRGLPGPVCR